MNKYLRALLTKMEAGRADGKRERKAKRRRSYYTEEDDNGFIFRRLPRIEEDLNRSTDTSANSMSMSGIEGDATTLSHKMIKHEKSSITKMLSEVVLSTQPHLQEVEVHSKLRQVVETMFSNHDMTEVLTLPNRPFVSSRLTSKVEEEKRLIQQYEQELREWEQSVEGVVQDCDERVKSLHKSIQSDDSTVTGVDDDPLVGTMDMDHVSQQLETLQSRVKEGLKQMENVQDDVMKKMEQHVDQLTTTAHHILPLPTHTPRSTLLQLKQIPDINDSVYNS
ncbi:uncharacterized protein [Dysidea avara]|uniref:uncharacterized protein n=1 Tax=Dysidea avara TaxID=196820 RepID=UPI003332931E